MARTFTRSVGLLLGVLLVTSARAATVRAQESDTALRDHIAYNIETNATVKKYDITVKVDHHNAILVGTVATDAQKAEAGRLAHVEGIDKVDNQIAVDRGTDQTLADRARRGMRRTGEALDDTWITTKVKWFFTGDSLLSGSDIHVTTTDRVVVLAGSVKTEEGRRRAEALANDTDGVKQVVNHLTIAR